MRLFLLALLGVFAATHPVLAEEGAVPATPRKAAKKGPSFKSILPDSVTGISEEDYGKIKAALIATSQEPAITAARKRLADLRDRMKLPSGRNEQEDLRKDMEAATDTMRKATMEAAIKFDPTLTKDSLMATLNAIEERQRQLAQEAAQKAAQQAAAERKAAEEGRAKTETAKADEPKPDGKRDKPAARENQQAALLAEVDGVSKADMAKFRAVAGRTRQDPDVAAARNALVELRKRAEYASADEKKDMRGEFESAANDLRKANVNAILKADPSLSKNTVETIVDAVSERQKASAQKGAKKPLSK